MEKSFTLSGKRLLLAFMTLLAFAVNANAGSTFYAYYTKVTSYPTGKGQIYVSPDYDEEVTDDKYTNEAEDKRVSTSASLCVYSKPADGFQFAGVSLGNPIYDEDLNITGYEVGDSIVATGNPAFITLESSITDNPTGSEEITSDSLTVASMMPLDPNNVFYALFTKVTVAIAENQSTLGSVKISKICNDKGDEITLTAIPAEGSTFVGWTLNGETVSTDAEYKITVGNETAEYVANFDNPNLITISFPEYGGYIHWYDTEYDLTLPEYTYSYSFSADSTVIAGENGAESYSTPIEGTYYASCQNPRILYGFGDVKVLKEVADPEFIYVDEYSLNRWSGDNGVSVDTLENTYAYYTVDMDNCKLNIATSIPAKQVYVAMPDSVYKNAGMSAAPEIIYTSQWAVPSGINTVKVNIPGMGKVYAIDGKEVTAPKQNGLYIKDGKKIIYKK